MRKPPIHAEVLKRTIRLPNGPTVEIHIDLSAAALAKFAMLAAENKTQQSYQGDGAFLATVVQPVQAIKEPEVLKFA
jgi:hypothetical protein